MVYHSVRVKKFTVLRCTWSVTGTRLHVIAFGLLIVLFQSTCIMQNKKETQENTTHHPPARLDGSFVSNRSDGLRQAALQVDCPRLPRHERLPLDLDCLSIRLGLLLCLRICLDPAQKVFPGSTELDVFDSDVDSLLQVFVADLLVEDNTDC